MYFHRILLAMYMPFLAKPSVALSTTDRTSMVVDGCIKKNEQVLVLNVKFAPPVGGNCYREQQTRRSMVFR
jgi:hypothetical protein